MSKLQKRIGQFLTWGTTLVWLVDYEDHSVTVYRPNQFPTVCEIGDELVGGDELPGFACPVAELFVMPGGSAKT